MASGRVHFIGIAAFRGSFFAADVFVAAGQGSDGRTGVVGEPRFGVAAGGKKW